MKKQLLFLIALLFMAAGAWAQTTHFVNPGVGTPIQNAIDGASAGDIIQVAAGHYNENIIIDKALSLVGAGRDVTIVEAAQGRNFNGGGQQSPVIQITGNASLSSIQALEINSPANISGLKQVSFASFGTHYNEPGWNVTGDMILVDDPILGCTSINTNVSGKIALIDRGSCSFSVKAYEAQVAGAIGVIIANTDDNLITMGAGDYAEDVNIPVLMIKKTDADEIKAELLNGFVNGSFVEPVQSDESITISGFTLQGHIPPTSHNFSNVGASANTNGLSTHGIQVTQSPWPPPLRQNIIVTDNAFKYCGFGVLLSHTTGFEISNNLFIRETHERQQGGSIINRAWGGDIAALTACSNGVIENNEGYAPTGTINVTSGSSFVEIKNNLIDAPTTPLSGDDGYTLNGISVTVGSNNNITIEGNTIKGLHGIYPKSGYNTGWQGAAVSINGAIGFISNNIFEDNTIGVETVYPTDYAGETVVLRNNDFINNSFGVFNYRTAFNNQTAQVEIDAQQNYWNTTSGPVVVDVPVASSTANFWTAFFALIDDENFPENAVSDMVDFAPYLQTNLPVQIFRNGDLISGHETIQAAINEAFAGDEIQVSEGNYPEQVIIGAGLNGLKLIGAVDIDGKPTSKIDLSTVGPGPGLQVSNSSDLIIQNFEITGATTVGSARGWGVIATATENIILDNLHSHNNVSDGIRVRTTANATIQNCKSINNSDGITFYAYGTIHNNIVGNSSMRGIYVNGQSVGDNAVGTVTITKNTVYENLNGGAIGCSDARVGGIIVYSAAANPAVLSVIIEENEVHENVGPGILLYKVNNFGPSSEPGQPVSPDNISLVKNNTVYDNIDRTGCNGPGDGILIYMSHFVEVEGNLIYGNENAGVRVTNNYRYHQYGPTLNTTLTGNTIYDNDYGILVQGGSVRKVENTVVQNNKIYDNNTGLENLDNFDEVVDAICNWWGTAIGSEIDELIEGNVDYSTVLLSDVIDPSDPNYTCGGPLPTPGPVTTISDITIECIPGTISVPVTVTDFNNVGAISLVLNYDHTILGVTDVVLNSAIQSGGGYQVLPNGILTISYFSDLGVSLADGSILFTINFDYIGSATCPDNIVSAITFDYSVPGYCEYAPPGLDSQPYSTDPPANYFIAGSVSIVRTTPPAEVGGPVAIASTVECASEAVAPTTLPVVKDVCGVTLSPTAGSPIKHSVNHIDFSSAVTTGPTQAPETWYTDRYAPAGFESQVVFAGDNRLKHSIHADDGANNRPSGLQGGFYNTQGRKYDLGVGTDYMEIKLYIPSDWATTNKRMAGFWGTAFNASDVISGYPIVEFASDNSDPRFQVWEGNAGWVSIGLPTGFSYDTWYLLKIKILPSGQFLYSAGDLNYTTVSYGNSGSVRMGNVILQGYNYDPVDPLNGVTYDIYWDDFMWNDTYSAPACEGIISYTYDYIDCAGHAFSWIYTYTLERITAPIVPANGGSTVQCYADALVEPTPPDDVTDVCGAAITGVLASAVDSSIPFIYPGTRTYTFTFTDCAGLVSEWKYIYTIDDTTLPTITCPADITQTAGTGVCYAIITELGTPVVSDNCTNVADLIVTNDAPANNEYPIGTTIVTWTVEDAAGNTNTCEQTITVTDDEAPTITCPADITVNVDESVNPSATGFATGTDLCGTVTITFSDAWASGTCVGTGTITRTWKATDEAGNEATCPQTITVVDNNTPAIVCPTDIAVNNDAGLCSTEVTFALPTSMDPGYNEGWENENYVMGDYFGWNKYNSTISSVASGTDGIYSKSGLRHGLIEEPGTGYTGVFSRIGGYNSSFCNGYRVSVDVYMDLTDPAVLADTYGWDLSVGSSKQDGNHLRDFIFHTASNLYGHILVGASNNSNFARRNDIATLNHYAITSTGWYTFEWIFRDEAGALAVDLNLLDGNGTWLWTETRTNAADLIATIVGGNRYMWFTFVATEKLAIDNAGIQRNASVTSNYPSGYAFPVGTTTVTVTSTDCCGNVSNCSFNVTVTDNELPTISCPTPAASYYVNVGSTWVATGLDAIIGDNCGVPVLSYSVDGGANFIPGDANGYAFPIGTTPVIYKVTDASNNVETCTFDITVTGIDISGAVTYYNSSNTAMNNVIIKLQDGGTDIHTTTTDATGNYAFSNVVPGTYDVVFSTVKPVGGVNSSDAAQVNFWSVNPSAIEKVRFYAGDVNNNNSISAGDAGMIQAYFLSMGANAFLRSPWTFWIAGETISANPGTGGDPALVVPAGGPMVNQDFYALVTGDFNRSFTPGNMKSVSESLNMVYGEVIEIAPNTAFELPVNAAIEMEVGAVSLIINVPADKLEVQGVYLTNDPATPVNYSITGDELRISWYSLTPINLNDGDALLTLQMFATDLSGNDNIYLSLAADPLNELADGSYNVNENALISVDIIKATALGIDNPDLAGKLRFANYPNPFKGNTNFAFTVPTDGKVTLEVYNITGTSVMVMLDQVMPAGDHLVRMDAGALKPGVYMATLTLKENETMLRKTIKVIAY